jgi:protein CpxP
MTQHQDQQTPVPAPSHAPRTRRRWVIAATIAGVLSVLSVAGIGYAKENSDMMGHHGMHHPMTQEGMSKHIDKMVDHILTDGTQEQKDKVRAIAQGALKDLYPLHEQHRTAHQQVVKLLTQPSIDRAALEQVRADEMRLADQVSRRITQAVADAAEVLTPEQRMKLADHMKKRMG